MLKIKKDYPDLMQNEKIEKNRKIEFSYSDQLMRIPAQGLCSLCFIM